MAPLCHLFTIPMVNAIVAGAITVPLTGWQVSPAAAAALLERRTAFRRHRYWAPRR